VQRLFWGTGLYLAGVGLLGLGIGALLRHTAGAITATLGILLMLSTLVQLLMMTSDWFTRIYPYCPPPQVSASRPRR
jgi:ABC-2 type transport system permease protein